MHYRYQKPNTLLQDYVRTVLILEGFAQPIPTKLPLVTTGMPLFFCKTQKENEALENIVQLTLFGKSSTADCWQAGEKTTIIAYFFKPFALATLFNIAASKLAESPIELTSWDPHKTNALKTQLSYANSTGEGKRGKRF